MSDAKPRCNQTEKLKKKVSEYILTKLVPYGHIRIMDGSPNWGEDVKVKWFNGWNDEMATPFASEYCGEFVSLDCFRRAKLKYIGRERPGHHGPRPGGKKKEGEQDIDVETVEEEADLPLSTDAEAGEPVLIDPTDMTEAEWRASVERRIVKFIDRRLAQIEGRLAKMIEGEIAKIIPYLSPQARFDLIRGGKK